MMAGLGPSLVPSTIVATQGLPAGMTGLGSALMNTAQLLGGALGLAILVTIAAARTRAEVSLSAAQARTDGFAHALATSAAVAVLAIVLLRSGAGHGRGGPSVAGNAASGRNDTQPPTDALTRGDRRQHDR